MSFTSIETCGKDAQQYATIKKTLRTSARIKHVLEHETHSFIPNREYRVSSTPQYRIPDNFCLSKKSSSNVCNNRVNRLLLQSSQKTQSGTTLLCLGGVTISAVFGRRKCVVGIEHIGNLDSLTCLCSVSKNYFTMPIHYVLAPTSLNMPKMLHDEQECLPSLHQNHFLFKL